MKNFLALTLASLTLTGCLTVKNPIGPDELTQAKTDEPFGYLAMTVSPDQTNASPEKTYFQFKAIEAKTKKEILLRAEKSDTQNTLTPERELPLIFKLKPGRYLLTDFSIKMDRTRYRGRYFEGFSLDFGLSTPTFIEVKENTLVHTGIYKYKHTEKIEDITRRTHGAIEVAYDRPSQKTWAKQEKLLEVLQATYIKKIESQYTAVPLNWVEEVVAN